MNMHLWGSQSWLQPPFSRLSSPRNAHTSIPKTTKPNAPIRTDNSGKRLPVVPGAAHHRENYSAVVRRLGGGVDGLPAVLPVGAAGRVLVCARAGPLLQAAGADADPHRPAAVERAGAAYLSGRAVEARAARRPDM